MPGKTRKVYFLHPTLRQCKLWTKRGQALYTGSGYRKYDAGDNQLFYFPRHSHIINELGKNKANCVDAFDVSDEVGVQFSPSVHAAATVDQHQRPKKVSIEFLIASTQSLARVSCYKWVNIQAMTDLASHARTNRFRHRTTEKHCKADYHLLSTTTNRQDLQTKTTPNRSTCDNCKYIV